MAPRRADRHTAIEILDAAERLAQTKGFNGFSYADIAAELGISKAALHYHYPGKAELGEALVERYTSRFAAALAEIDRSIPGPPAKLEAYAAVYLDVLRQERMCLCGMLAAEFGTLPPTIQARVLAFFRVNEVWLAAVFEQGRREGTLRFEGSASEAARALTGSLEGAMLVARMHGDTEQFRATIALLLAGLMADLDGSGRRPARRTTPRTTPRARSTG